MSGALFVGGSGSGSGGKHLVEFRAGRLSLRDGVVTADRRKGLLYLFQGDDSLLHFCWRDRTTGHVEDDYILFPGDCEYARVPQCTTGRVYVLKFTASSRRLFFWMQEPKTDKDDEYCRRINEVLNNPPSVGSGRSGSSGAPEGEFQNILNNMTQQQLMQLLGGVGHMGGLSSLLSTMGRSPTGQSSRSNSATPTSRPPSETPRAPSRPPRVQPVNVTTPTTPSTPDTPNTPSTQTQPPPAARGRPIHLSDLQKYLSGLVNTSNEDGSTSRTSSNEVVDLASVIATPEVIATASPHAAGLMEHLPTPPPDQQKDDIKTTLLSPQFSQAMSLFSNAIASGQLGPIISQFGLGSDAVTAAQNGDMKAFIKALEKEESKTAEETKKPKDKDEDDNMALD